MTTITLTFDSWWNAVFEVDISKSAPACKESLDFFGDPIERESDTPEENVKAYLRFAIKKIIYLSTGHPAQVIVKIFANEEGMVRLDGSQGIKLVDCDPFDWFADGFAMEVKEVA